MRKEHWTVTISLNIDFFFSSTIYISSSIREKNRVRVGEVFPSSIILKTGFFFISTLHFCWTEMEYNVNFLPLIKNWQIPFQRCPEISFLFLPFFFSWTEMEYNANFLSLIKIGESPSRDVQRLSILFRWGLNDRELMFASHLRECVWFSRSPGFGLYLYLFNHTLNAFSITHWKIRKFPRSELVGGNDGPLENWKGKKRIQM